MKRKRLVMRKGRSHLVLRPSKKNPRVKRWVNPNDERNPRQQRMPQGDQGGSGGRPQAAAGGAPKPKPKKKQVDRKVAAEYLRRIRDHKTSTKAERQQALEEFKRYIQTDDGQFLNPLSPTDDFATAMHTWNNYEGWAMPPIKRADPMPTPGRRWVDHLPGMPEHTLVAHVQWKDGPMPDGASPDDVVDAVRAGAAEFTPARQKLHDRILSDLYDSVPDVPDDKMPTAVLMMGGTASGKSSIAQHIDKKEFVHCDADDIKAMLPEYAQSVAANAMDAASVVHEESSYLVKKLRAKAIENRKSLIMDGTGANLEKYVALANQLKEAGYHVTLLATDVDGEEAMRRMKARADKRGRWVPPEFVEDAYRKIPGNIEPMTEHVDDFRIYNTRTNPGTLVWSREGGQEQIHDRSFVSDFRTRYGKSGRKLMKKGDRPRKPPHLDGARLDELLLGGIKHERAKLAKMPKKFDVSKTGKGIVMIEDDAAIEP